jgi:hypothetical protein
MVALRYRSGVAAVSPGCLLRAMSRFQALACRTPASVVLPLATPPFSIILFARHPRGANAEAAQTPDGARRCGRGENRGGRHASLSCPLPEYPVRPRTALAVLLIVVAGPSLAQTPISRSVPKLPRLNVPPLSDLFVLTSSMPNSYLLPGQQARVRAQLASTFTANLGVQLRYTSSALSGPSSITIPAGKLFAEFLVTAGSVKTITTAGVSGWLIDSTQSKLAQVEIRPNATCNPTPSISVPASVHRSTSITVTIRMSCAPTSSTAVQVTSSLPGVIPPPPGNVVTVAAGSSSASYQTTTGNVTATTVVTISAFIPNTSPIVRAPDMQVAVSP